MMEHYDYREEEKLEESSVLEREQQLQQQEEEMISPTITSCLHDHDNSTTKVPSNINEVNDNGNNMITNSDETETTATSQLSSPSSTTAASPRTKVPPKKTPPQQQFFYEPTDSWWKPPLKTWIPETNLEIMGFFILYNILVTVLAHSTTFCGSPNNNNNNKNNINNNNNNTDTENPIMTTGVILTTRSFCDNSWVLNHDGALTGLTVGMFLLLVFRVNQAYHRFWEGRKKWGRIREVSIDFSRTICFHIQCRSPQDVQDRRRAIDYLTAFCIALKLHIRRERHFVQDMVDLNMTGDVPMSLTHTEMERIQGERHMPLHCQDMLSAYMVRQVSRGNLSDYLMSILSSSTLAVMSDSVGSCEQIRDTPIPLSYALQLRYLIIIWLLIYPLHLVAYYDWWTIVLTSAADIAVLGIESMSSAIENPYGYDRNDLDLDSIVAGISRDVHDVLHFVESKPHLFEYHDNDENDDATVSAATLSLATTASTTSTTQHENKGHKTINTTEEKEIETGIPARSLFSGSIVDGPKENDG